MVVRAKKGPPKKARAKKAKVSDWYLTGEQFAAIGCDDPAREFAQMLLDEPSAHCRWVHLAVRRHCMDLRHAAASGQKSPFLYQPEKAQRAIRFVGRFRVYEGELIGQRLTLLAWQKFIVSQVYGWRLASDPRKRRFKYVYIAVPRKNGKTGLVAPLALYHMSHPPKGGRFQVFSVATKEDQAKISWKDGCFLLGTAEKGWRDRNFRERTDQLTHIKSGSVWSPLGSDSKTQDGLRPDQAIIDELHAWPGRELWDVVTSGFASAFSPLVFQITTAGNNPEGICGEQENRVKRVLEAVETGTYRGEQVDEAVYFGIVWTIDKGDRWDDERVWAKANPSLGSIKSEAFMRELCSAAKVSPGARREFLIKHLNQWQTTGAARWLDPHKWAACTSPTSPRSRHRKATSTLGEEPPASGSPNETAEGLWERLRGREVYCGLDLASTTDTSSFCVIAVEGDGEKPDVLASWQFWLPGEDLARRQARDHVPYDSWVREGFLTLTPGEVADVNQIEADILAIIEKYELQVALFAIDPGWAQGAGQRLAERDGLPVHSCPNRYTTMTPALNELERLVISGRLKHGGNPMATNHALNACLRIGGVGGRLLDKAKSNGRIDGLAALSMAIAAQLHTDEEPAVNVGISFA